ncbi:hypothetical protein U9M48_037538 [Paspalum notatum var. saurae]|uniref:Uncharacterized protein n=1 Tax=Paspalum notatum var. saurae TaxID=547442 RepID=A0AAQ3UG62_PASNO
MRPPFFSRVRLHPPADWPILKIALRHLLLLAAPSSYWPPSRVFPAERGAWQVRRLLTAPRHLLPLADRRPYLALFSPPSRPVSATPWPGHLIPILELSIDPRLLGQRFVIDIVYSPLSIASPPTGNPPLPGYSHRNRKTNLSVDDSEPSATATSPARMNSGQRLVDGMPVNPKKMVFMSTQEMCYATASPILNVRCNPGDVLFTINLLNPKQHAALVALGFGPFLAMLTDAVESRNLLPWLLDRINPNEMVLRIGPGKNIAVTPSIISMVLGILHGGKNIKLYTTEEGCQFKKDLIKDLGHECLFDDDDIYISNLQEEILKGNVDELFFRCFFMIVFNRYLFPTTTYKFDYSDITKSKHPEDFGQIDWSQEVFNNLQFAIRRWHYRDRTQRTQIIYGCSIFLIVLYLDHLHHMRSPPDWLSTPRIRFYNKATIEGLTIVDRILHEDGTEEYGFLPFKSSSSTCYAAAALRHAWGDPSHFDQQQIPEVQIPRLRDLLSRPLGCLTGPTSHIVERLFDIFDTTIMRNVKSIETLKLLTLRSQLQLADLCRPVLDELISSQQTINNPNSGECSTQNAVVDDIGACAQQNDVPPSPVMTCAPRATHPDPLTPFGSPQNIFNSGATLDGQGHASTSTPKPLSVEDITLSKYTPVTLTSDVVPNHDFPGDTLTFRTDHSKSCLYDESMERDTQEPRFMLAEAVNLIKQCLPDKCDLKKAKMIFLPILVRRRWSVYCVNLGQKRSQDYRQSTTSWKDYHDPLANTIIPALSDAEHAKDMRADILYYLCFHTNNGISQIPDALLKFRDG